METSIPPAFTPPTPSTWFTNRHTIHDQRQAVRFPYFRRRTTAASRIPVRSAVDTTQETVLFESLFPDVSAATVLTPENEAVSLIEHVKSRNAAGETVLLGWLRHYGCMLCKKQTADWISIQPQLEDIGNVCMTLIGNGSPGQAVEFVEEMGWNGYMFTDPERTTYNALQFRTGLLVTFNLPAVRKIITTIREGKKQTWTRIPTDAFQQGGAVLVDKNGVVRLFHTDAFAGDHFDKDRLVEEIRAVAQ